MTTNSDTVCVLRPNLDISKTKANLETRKMPCGISYLLHFHRFIFDLTMFFQSFQIAIQLAAHILEKYYPSHIIARLSITEEEFWDNKVKSNVLSNYQCIKTVFVSL